MTITFGSLFSGFGGFDLGFERAGMKCIWQSEIEPYACKVLKKHWPEVKNLGDITAIDWRTVERPDVICGGFPCQDISVCGKGEGITGKRSGLWKEMFCGIQTLKPSFVVIENVAAITFRGLDTVLGDLARIGFDAEWQTISAWAFGSHHKRERIYIVAYRPDTHCFRWQGRPHAMRCSWSHSKFTGLVRSVLQLAVPAGSRGRISDGISSRVDRLRGIGNSVIPQKAEWIGRQIIESLT